MSAIIWDEETHQFSVVESQNEFSFNENGNVITPAMKKALLQQKAKEAGGKSGEWLTKGQEQFKKDALAAQKASRTAMIAKQAAKASNKTNGKVVANLINSGKIMNANKASEMAARAKSSGMKKGLAIGVGTAAGIGLGTAALAKYKAKRKAAKEKAAQAQ
jgi:hypothetical protein